MLRAVGHLRTPKCSECSEHTAAHVVPQPIMAKKALFCVFVINMVFWPETVEKRLDLTSHMSYTDAEGRGSQSPTALSIRIAHIAR